jgi:lipopolysaccharide heptosyltransferase II
LAAIGKILVVRLSSIGDIILTTPLLRSLKTAYPEASVTFIIKKQYRELLSCCPYIDELIEFDAKEGFAGLRKLKTLLKQQQFDLFVDIHKNWRSRYLRFGLGVDQIHSYHKQLFKRTLLIWFKINLYGAVKPVYERYFEAVTDLKIQYDGRGTEIHFAQEKSDHVKELLNRSGIDLARPLIILCPSATYLNKRWKADGFIETGRYLISNRFAQVVVLGGPEDTELCTSIALAIGKGAVSLAGKLSLSESAAQLKLASLVIANDSGLLHMAQSQKVPVIGIYGPTTRELGYFPVDQDSIVIETNLPCRPCTHNGLNKCPKKHFKCMNKISSEQVIKAALQYLPDKN